MSPAHFSRRFRAAYGETPYGSRFAEIVGETPTAYRNRPHDGVVAMPSWIAMARSRPARHPSRIGEASSAAAA